MSKSTFLPAGEKIPEAKSNYLKLRDDVTKFRIVSPAITGYIYWTNEKKPVRLHEAPKEKPADIRLNDDGSYTVKYFWAFKVIDRKDAMIKILELTQTGIMRQLQALLENEDWGEPQEYDITINGKGEGLERRYTVQPSPHKPLTAEEKSAVERTEIDLQKLFAGDDPFGTKIAPVEDQVDLKSIPF